MSFSATFRRISRLWRPGPPEAAGATVAAEADGLLDAAFLRRLDRLALQASPRLRGDAIGPRPSWRRLPASDFREHRQYLPGDDLRHVDWNASARSQHVFVKLGERPKEATIHLLLDSTASMQWGRPSKLWAARRLAAALGYIALNHGDRLMITDVSGGVAPWGPQLGKGQVPGLLRHLRDLPLQRQADLPAAAYQLARQQTHGGYAVLISDLAGLDDAAPVLAHLRPPAWQVLVLHLLHPAELDPELRGELELHDAETGERANYDLDPSALERYRAYVTEWCATLERDCLAQGAAYARLLADWPIEQAVLPYLRRRGVIEAA
jgi:uncharacterized protein (DUF58 family)